MNEIDGKNLVIQTGTLIKLSDALTDKGTLGATLSIQSSYTDALGSRKTFDERVSINFTKKVAQRALNELSQGDFIQIMGAMGTIRYERDGQKKSFTVVRAWDYTVLVKGSGGSKTVPASAVVQAEAFDDLPF